MKSNQGATGTYVSKPFAQGILNTLTLARRSLRGEFVIPRKTFEEYRTSLLAITAQYHDVTIRVVDCD